jgi:hypothetical protein
MASQFVIQISGTVCGQPLTTTRLKQPFRTETATNQSNARFPQSLRHWRANDCLAPSYRQLIPASLRQRHHGIINSSNGDLSFLLPMARGLNNCTPSLNRCGADNHVTGAAHRRS